MRILLASTSNYRRELLARLKLDFITATPRTDETRRAGESASALVRRLAAAKAHSLAADYPQSLIIGSDQVACLDADILGKPGDHGRAVRQLQAAGGKTLVFHTGICLLNTANHREQLDEVCFEVEFRKLSDAEIERYLRREQPYDCAGSFKSEGFGISLCRRFCGDDPTALIGLPLIRLAAMLRAEGVAIP